MPRKARPNSRVKTSRTTICFCLPNCAARTEGHGQAAANQNRSIYGSDLEAQCSAGHRKFVVVGKSIDQVGAKHPAKEHDLRSQEDPHAQRSSVALLLRIGKVMQ